MRAHEFQPSKLVIFDIDDTLVHTQTKVHVIRDGQVIKSLNSHDFTHYKLQPGETFDFGDFADAREFFEKSKPIIPMINQLKSDIATGNKVVMVTARADFNDRELFLDTFRKYGVDMNKVHVYRAGNMQGKMQTEEKKKIIIRDLLDKGNYDKAIMYDDAVPNLDAFMSLKKEYPETKFYAWHVSLEGEASEFGRTNENFADGKHPGRKGLAKRSGVNTKASISSLRNTAKHSSGEKQRMAHWLANMKAGRAKKK
jgi:FMN phosphatase YigB (HAD superfamily)